MMYIKGNKKLKIIKENLESFSTDKVSIYKLKTSKLSTECSFHISSVL